MRIRVASRCGLRAPTRFRTVSMRSLTSSGVRYSRGRRAALDTRRGGTFPFTVIGPLPFLARGPLWLIGAAYPTFPFMAEDGKGEVHELERLVTAQPVRRSCGSRKAWAGCPDMASTHHMPPWTVAAP